MSQNPNPEQYNQYSQQAPSYSQAPGQQPNGYVAVSYTHLTLPTNREV